MGHSKRGTAGNLEGRTVGSLIPRLSDLFNVEKIGEPGDEARQLVGMEVSRLKKWFVHFSM